jgi:hypothetical protein
MALEASSMSDQKVGGVMASTTERDIANFEKADIHSPCRQRAALLAELLREDQRRKCEIVDHVSWHRWHTDRCKAIDAALAAACASRQPEKQPPNTLTVEQAVAAFDKAANRNSLENARRCFLEEIGVALDKEKSE